MKRRYSCSICSFFIKATMYSPGLVFYCGKAYSSHLGKPPPSQCPKEQGERRGRTLPGPSRSQRQGKGFPMGGGVTERCQGQNSSTDVGSGQGRKHQSPPCPSGHVFCGDQPLGVKIEEEREREGRERGRCKWRITHTSVFTCKQLWVSCFYRVLTLSTPSPLYPPHLLRGWREMRSTSKRVKAHSEMNWRESKFQIRNFRNTHILLWGWEEQGPFNVFPVPENGGLVLQMAGPATAPPLTGKGSRNGAPGDATHTQEGGGMLWYPSTGFFLLPLFFLR